jgi:hypothetical protein
MPEVWYVFLWLIVATTKVACKVLFALLGGRR